MQGKARKLKIYSPREYFRPLGRIKRFKWIFRKVLVFHCFMCHIAKKLLCCQKLLVVRKSTLPGTSRKDVLLPPLSALCSQEMLSFSYFEFPPFKCLSINSFQHPPRLSQFSHLKTLQRKASIKIKIANILIMIIMIIIGKCSPKLVQLISPCHLSPPSTKSSSTKELQLSLSSNNSRYVHVVESWNNHSRFLLTKLRMISICDYTCRGGLLDRAFLFWTLKISYGIQIFRYESFSDVGEIRVWFASKILTPCRMH